MTATRKSIIALPNQNLRQRSKDINAINKEVKQIIANMQAATLDWEKEREHEVGVALAAIQIDKPVRVIVVRTNPDNKKDTNFSVFINPEITKHEGRAKPDFEGCLSVPDVYGKVPRYPKVRLKAIGLDGKPLKLTAEGFMARVFQHEI